jgi:glycosyltransferase involved in cell wall biosynthesis
VRIAHVTDCYLPRLGGIERQVHGLATAQQQLGHDVEIITAVPAGITGEPDGFRVHRPRGVDSSRSAITPIRYRGCLAGRRIVGRGDFDVVHVHASTFSPLGYLTASSCAGQVPTAVTLHSLWAYATPVFAAADSLLGWRRWPVAWSAVSSVAADGLASVLRGPTVSVLPNGVRAEDWSLPVQTRTATDRVVIVSTMRLAARKRPLQLLRMLHAVRQQVPASIRIEVDIIGDGPLAPRLREFLHNRQMADWVHLHGQLPAAEIRRRYADADLYVSPATLESFGIAALEARAAGLPVIAFAQTGVADFVRDDHEGVLVGSDAEMATAMAALVRSPDRRNRIRLHNSGTTPSQTWPSVTTLSQELYDRAQALMPSRHRRGQRLLGPVLR